LIVAAINASMTPEMTMQDSAMRKHLSKLQSEFARLPANAPARPGLAGLIAAIEHQLDHTDDAIQRTQLLADVSVSMRRFEVEHPSLTASLGQIFSGLSSMGI